MVYQLASLLVVSIEVVEQVFAQLEQVLVLERVWELVRVQEEGLRGPRVVVFEEEVAAPEQSIQEPSMCQVA